MQIYVWTTLNISHFKYSYIEPIVQGKSRSFNFRMMLYNTKISTVRKLPAIYSTLWDGDSITDTPHQKNCPQIKKFCCEPNGNALLSWGNWLTVVSNHNRRPVHRQATTCSFINNLAIATVGNEKLTMKIRLLCKKSKIEWITSL